MSEIVDPVIAVPAVAGPVGVDPAAAGKVEAIVELFTAVNPEGSKLSKQSVVQPRGIPRPARAPLRISILPAPLPKR